MPPPALALLLAALVSAPRTTPGAAPGAPPPEAPAVAPDTSRARLSFSPTFAPLTLYSPSYGFGVEGGLTVRNAVRPGSEVIVGARVSQFLQRADVVVLTADPHAEPVFGALALSAEATTRRRYYGTGPLAPAAARHNLAYTALTADARAGYYPLGHSGLLLQPGVRLTWDRLRRADEDAPGARDLLGDASRAALDEALGQTRAGVSLGLDVSSDRLDRRLYPRRGSAGRLEARRFYALDGSGLRFNRAVAQGTGFLPLGRLVLVGEATAALTRADGDAPLPFAYLPTLDDRIVPAYPTDRLAGRDVVALGLGGRYPLFALPGLAGLDAYAMAYFGNAYTDVFAEFSPAVSLRAPAGGASGRAPLRPSLALGGQVVNLAREAVIVGGVIGLSPEGFQLVALELTYDLRAPRLYAR
ncbi:MAG: hypothetical protein ACK41D_00200 [Rubricoccaceae bacterium]